jgi:hypothetical protein
MAAKTPEAPREHKDDSFEEFDDFEAYQRVLRETMARADALIEKHGSGAALTPAEKRELPVVVGKLRQLLAQQLKWNGKIAKLDREDGSYDNAHLDNQLRRQLKALRNMDTNLNRLWGTRTVRKIRSWFAEDVPNWFGVTWAKAKDNLKHLAKTAGIVVGIGALGTVGGYALAYGGVGPGLEAMSRHFAPVGEAAGKAGSGIGKWFSKLWGK